MESQMSYSKELYSFMNPPQREKENQKDIDPESSSNDLNNKEKVKYKKKSFNQIFKTKNIKKIKY
jgi:hypothetical protein